MANLVNVTDKEAQLWSTMIEKELNAPLTSSAGRLFDGVAALLGLSDRVDYEGEAAIELEELAASWIPQSEETDCYPASIINPSLLTILDWAPIIQGVLADRERISLACIAAKFHRTLALCIVAMAKQRSTAQVILSGGCFQNRLLSERVLTELREAGFVPFTNQQVPPNDGGISVGQILGGCNVLVGAR